MICANSRLPFALSRNTTSAVRSRCLLPARLIFLTYALPCTGTGTLPLPSSFSSKVPGIAFKVPDLEAFAQLTLTRLNSNGELAACIQSTLANGWSMHQPAVEWVTGTITLLSLFTCLYFFLLPLYPRTLPSLSPASAPSAAAAHRLVDICLLFQHIALTGALHVDPPSVYTAFTTNFAWSFGLITASSSRIQRAIDNMRHLTGSKGQDGALDINGYVNRKTSPYNLATLHTSRRDFIDVPTVSSQNALAAGIPLYVNSAGVSTANAFMSLFFTTLFLILITIAVFACVYLVLRLIRKPRGGNGNGKWRGRYTTFVQRVSIRLVRSFALIILLYPYLFIVQGIHHFSPGQHAWFLSMDDQGLLARHPPLRSSTPCRMRLFGFQPFSCYSVSTTSPG